jgi:osmotically-inducible protein OsmY
MKTCSKDTALADHIRSALHQNSQLSDQDIAISVEEGWVLLEGKVTREADRRLVQLCVENILGVCGITNNLTFSRIHSN